MNKHITYGLIGIVIAAVLIVVALGLNRAEAPLLGEGVTTEPVEREETPAVEPDTVEPAPAREPISVTPEPTRGCVVGGCSGQLCVEAGNDMVTTCEWREQYACYQSATCERQETGECGWTDTPVLTQCLAAAEEELDVQLQN
jgi:eight-cysteine-cluster-containing protein